MCRKKHDVIIFTSDPGVFEKHLQIVDEKQTVTHKGDIYLATNKPEEAFSDCDLVIVTYPANMMKKAAEAMEPYISSETLIGAVPGNGGSEYAFHRLIERGNIFFLIERVPAIARLVKKGSTVKSTVYRKEMHVAALPAAEAEKCAKLVESFFDIKCTSIPNILNLMLASGDLGHSASVKMGRFQFMENGQYISDAL